MNVGNQMGERSSTRVRGPPGGASSISLSWGEPEKPEPRRMPAGAAYAPIAEPAAPAAPAVTYGRSSGASPSRGVGAAGAPWAIDESAAMPARGAHGYGYGPAAAAAAPAAPYGRDAAPAYGGRDAAPAYGGRDAAPAYGGRDAGYGGRDAGYGGRDGGAYGGAGGGAGPASGRSYGSREAAPYEAAPAPAPAPAVSIIPGGAAALSSNAYASGANQNSGNVLTDRRTTRVLSAPGGKSSIVFG